MPSKRGPYNQYEFRQSRASAPKSTVHAALHPPPRKKRKKATANDCTAVPALHLPSLSSTLEAEHSPVEESYVPPSSTSFISDDASLETRVQSTEVARPSPSLSSTFEAEHSPVEESYVPPSSPSFMPDHASLETRAQSAEVLSQDEEWHFVEHVDSGTMPDEDGDLCADSGDEEAIHSDEEATTTLQSDNPASKGDPDDSDDEDVLAIASDLHLDVPNRIKVLLLLATKFRHNLTYSAAECIMRLAGVLSHESLYTPTKHMLKTAISLYSSSVTEHHICPHCGNYIGVFFDTKECDNCLNEIDAKTNKKKGNFFLYLSIADQIRSLLINGLANKLIQPQHRQKIKPGNFEDIQDGKLYKKLVALNCLSFNFFVDGLKVGTTSRTSAWPVLLSLNELPLYLRRKHIFIANVWLGKEKPDMNEYLKPFIKECIMLQRDGITIKIGGQDKTYKIVPLVCVSDSVARPLLRRSNQFNGSFGCGLCYHPGYQMKRGRGTCRSYTIADREFPLRTHDETLELAARAIASKKVQRGIKGLSILTEIRGFDIINCLDLDLFHALVNCAKRFTNLWLHKRYSSKDFSVSNKFNLVDQRLLSITPTNVVSRAPRSLSERSDFRGHEWFHWVVFYSIPVLAGILPKRFLTHWSLLVRGIVLLMQNSVSKSDLVYAGRFLRQFNAEIDGLYGPQHVTFSTHLLTHLENSTWNFAQPWTHSAFLFESFLAAIKSAIHSSNGVAHQIVKYMQLKIALKSMQKDLEHAMSDKEKEFLQSVMCAASPLVDPYLCIQDIGFLGVPKTVTLAPNLHRIIMREGIEVELGKEYLMFDRCTVNGEVYQSVAYSKVEKQNNSIVLLSDDTTFEIHSFIVIEDLGLALGHFLVKNPSRLCNDIPHINIYNENVEDTLRCVRISEFDMKLLSFSLDISESEAVRFACVNVLQMEVLH